VVDAIRPKLRSSRALVSPARAGWITVYVEAAENQDFSLLRSFGQHLSRQLETVAYATMVHDGDVFFYYLAENGRRVDEYDSDPDYFGPVDPAEKEQLLGDARAFLKYCAPGVTLRKVEGILHPDFLARVILRLNPLKWVEPAQTVGALLAECLGIARNRALCGYKYASHGELGEDLGPWMEVV
jgi:hypothetical protein